MKTAKFIRNIGCWSSIASLYKLSEPLSGYNYVIVSSRYSGYWGSETYIFGSDENGKVTNFTELYGSYKDGLSKEYALSIAGYTIE